MIKFTIFLVVLASALSQTPTWIGSWSVVNESSNKLACDVPLHNTVADITSSSDTLVLSGESSWDLGSVTWLLNWGSNDQNPSFCETIYCATGTLTQEQATTSATIVWTFSGTDVTCTVVMTSVDSNSAEY